MSWIKRRGQPSPNSPGIPPPPQPVQMYNPGNQHSNQENQWQQQQIHNNWYPPQQQQQPPGPNETTTNWPATYNNQPVYNPASTQYGYQQQQYQQPNYGNNLQYSHQQYSTDNNLYAPQQETTQQQPQPNESDAWNWGWGDEDNSNMHQQQQASITTNNTIPTTSNNIVDSFTVTNNAESSWNWALDEANKRSTTQTNQQDNNTDELFPKMGKLASNSNKSVTITNQPMESTIQSASQIDHLSIMTGKRGKLETPQWSIESQLSQESSDDILQTSESDKMLSRSSTLSHSPISGVEAAHNSDDLSGGNNRVSSDLYLVENKEVVRQQDVVAIDSLPPSAKSPVSAGNPYKHNTNNSLSHKYRTSQQNPFPSTFHNNNSQSVNLETLPDNSEQPDSVIHSTQSLLRNVQRSNKSPPQQQVWPDNNEAPINDRNQYLETGQLSDVDLHKFNETNDLINVDNDTLPPPGLSRMVLGQIEQNEGNLLSNSGGYEPPPGLSRMVPGQPESNLNSGISALLSSDLRQPFQPIEPPEGLRRMVPGESSSPETSVLGDRAQNVSESDFNEIDSSHIVQQQRSATIGADTPPDTSFNSILSTSTTTTNRSETIGADMPLSSSTAASQLTINSNNNGDNKINRNSNNSNNVNNNKKQQQQESNSVDNNRRDSIEGQQQENDVGLLTNSIRNLTVGDNPKDGTLSGSSQPESNRKHSRQEISSDSDHHEPIKGKSPNTDRRGDRRYRGDNKDDKYDNSRSNRNRDRYSPNEQEQYREKKSDHRRRYKERRYEDDTDYYSDKEKDRRYKDSAGNRYDYERKYNSLRKDKDGDGRRRREQSSRDYGRDPRKNDYYYSRYENDYDNGLPPRSRASSRSDSVHDSYHEREHRHRSEKERHRRSQRDPFGGSYMQQQGFGYDPYNPYYQQYQYYENLRRTNPQAYAEWYRKYYLQSSGGQMQSSYGGEDRASVHSGRSSVNDELAKDRYTRQSYYSQTSLPHLGGYYRESQTHSISGQYDGLDDSSFAAPFDQTDTTSLNYEDNTLTTQQRLTPAKFATAHIKASISSGKLLTILPNYPLDGQPATVDLCSLESLLINDEDYQELIRFPGPLVKGVTHKKTIIEYCESKIRGANNNCNNVDIVDTESYILLWELLILLIRQNGMVVGADIAELLLKNRNQDPIIPRSASVMSNVSSNILSEANESSTNPSNQLALSETLGGSVTSVLKEDEITNKFREFLLYGSVKEALEWAMKYGLWGHALFLASKLDKRTYANVMMRFANGLTMNDPLQTLYQLLSGRVPAAVTCVADEKWGDWRPHLAMIISNSTQRPEINRKAITILGDTLMNRGNLYAAQFCYLMAEVGFSKYGSDGAKLVLLGSDHTNNNDKSVLQFATNEAIHMTEIYEYACSLNDNTFILPEFQYYTYLLSTRLVDMGLLENALSYLEKISKYIIQNPSTIQSSLLDKICVLADKLKFYDPVGDVEDDSEFIPGTTEKNRPDNSWLKDLRAIQNDYNMGLIPEQQNTIESTESSTNLDTTDQQQIYNNSTNQDVWQQQQQQQLQQWQQQQQHQIDQIQPVEYQQQQSDSQDAGGIYNSTQYQQDPQQQYWQNQSTWSAQQNIDTTLVSPELVREQQIQQNFYAQPEPDEIEKEPPEVLPQQPPQLSLPNQSQTKQSPVFNDDNITQKANKSPKQQPKSLDKSAAASTGWFGGIFSKLALKPKNQMKLPDDKNPSIVWDQENKRWINTDEDNNEVTSEFKAPPKMSDVMSKMGAPPPAAAVPSFNFHAKPEQTVQLVPQTGGVGGANTIQENPSDGGTNLLSQPNMFKMQKNRNLKKSYIDIFNPNGKTGAVAPTTSTAASLSNSMPVQAAPQMNFFIPQPANDPHAPTDFLTPAPPLQFDQNSQKQRNNKS